jgi:hypothetical protein
MSAAVVRRQGRPAGPAAMLHQWRRAFHFLPPVACGNLRVLCLARAAGFSA